MNSIRRFEGCSFDSHGIDITRNADLQGCVALSLSAVQEELHIATLRYRAALAAISLFRKAPRLVAAIFAAAAA